MSKSNVITTQDLDAALAARQAGLERAAAPRPGTPYPGVDQEGMPARNSAVPVNLATAEQSALRRLSPRRNRWPEVARRDARAAELEQRQVAASAGLAELHQQLQAAPIADADRISEWQLSDRQGPRPAPQAATIEREIREAQADVDGLTRAVGAVLAEKAELVERHRRRLVAEADKETEAAHGRVAALLDQLAAAREELVDARAASLWASCFPDPAAGQEPSFGLVAGGLRAPVERALSITHQIRADRVVDVLRADCDWLKTALTPAQRLLVEGPTVRAGDARWSGSPEGRAAGEAEVEARRRAFEREWGVRPSW